MYVLMIALLLVCRFQLRVCKRGLSCAWLLAYRNGVFYRQFVAASYPAVWREYRRTPTTNRHWYEVG